MILTIRTADEGGEASLTPEEYFDIYANVIANGVFDVIDIQLQMPAVIRGQLVKLAHDNDIKVIMSYHNFEKTPESNILETKLMVMQEFTADIGKIAVMPKKREDVLALLKVTSQMYDQLDIPIITMAMGDLGKISRVSGELFGSAATFGAAADISAPGQLNMGDLKNILNNTSKFLV